MEIIRIPLYFGPPIGLYDPGKFKDFAQIDVPRKLIILESPSKCNPEEHSKWSITYHYPDAGIGLTYVLGGQNRCLVSLLGIKRKEVNDITYFIFEEDSKSR